MGATCTATSRNNYVTNQILTSSALNADFNQLVTLANAFDGGCVTAGTLESDALNTTQFAPMLKGIKEGCKVSYSSATQVSIGKCLAAVNGNFVTTTVATTVAFGCTSCSSEVASTAYYVYIATGSTGTTLTPLILTTAPNEDGYDNSGNKVLAKFYNNASSDIQSHSIQNWIVSSFSGTQSTQESVIGAINRIKVRYLFGGASATLAVPTECAASPCVEVSDPLDAVTPPTRSSGGVYLNLTIADNTFKPSSELDCRCVAYDTTAAAERECLLYFDTGDNTWSSNSNGGYVTNIKVQNAAGALNDAYVQVTCEGEAF